jgi:hypothetical protein
VQRYAFLGSLCPLGELKGVKGLEFYKDYCIFAAFIDIRTTKI